jgi:hypothetical protein
MRRWWAIGAVLAFGLACGGLPMGAEETLAGERPPESPITWGLLMSWSALAIGGGSAVLGIWVDRDKDRPVAFALAMSGLISAAMLVGALQGYLDEVQAIETRANLERMIDMVEDIAASSGDPRLAELLKREGGARRPRPPGAKRTAPEAPPPEPPSFGGAPALPPELNGGAPPAPDAAPAPVAPAPAPAPEGATP